MMDGILRAPGAHLAGRDPELVRIARDLDRIEAGVHPWHVILWSGVDLVTECESFVRMLLLEGRIRSMVTLSRGGERIECTP